MKRGAAIARGIRGNAACNKVRFKQELVEAVIVLKAGECFVIKPSVALQETEARLRTCKIALRVFNLIHMFFFLHSVFVLFLNKTFRR